MDIQITQVAVQETLALDDPPPGAAAPSAEAVSRFSALMEEDTQVDAVDPAAKAATVMPSGQSMGDNILNGLQNLSTDLKSTWHALDTSLNGSARELGMHDLMRMQLSMATMSVQYDLVGKAVSRSTQNIDQLVKLQ